MGLIDARTSVWRCTFLVAFCFEMGVSIDTGGQARFKPFSRWFPQSCPQKLWTTLQMF